MIHPEFEIYTVLAENFGPDIPAAQRTIMRIISFLLQNIFLPSAQYDHGTLMHQAAPTINKQALTGVGIFFPISPRQSRKAFNQPL
jgi:hypothetical protein